jgi:hypothetical protein
MLSVERRTGGRWSMTGVKDKALENAGCHGYYMCEGLSQYGARSKGKLSDSTMFWLNKLSPNSIATPLVSANWDVKIPASAQSSH